MNFSRKFLYFVLIAFGFCFAFSQNVTTDCGVVIGQKSLSHNVTTFLGIPFAKAGRWESPVLLRDAGKCWSGDFKAQNYGPFCPQGDPVVGSEDCLSINLFVPEHPAAKPLPVMVYMYGGSSVAGASEGDEPTAFVDATQSVLAVTFNFRIGAFGYLALQALSETSPTGFSGNYGIMDCIAALKWVQKNVAAFGGDPGKVTIYGQSSGGTNVYALMASPLAKGLFHRALALSGSPRIDEPLSQAERDNWVFVQKAGCCSLGSSAAIVACLKSLSTQQVVDASPMNEFPFWAGLQSYFSTPRVGDYAGGLIIVDGYVLPKSLPDALSTPGFGPDVPFMLGHMSQENDLAPPYRWPLSADLTDYQTFLRSNFSVWDEALPQKVEMLYPAQEFDSLQQAYEVITNDIRVFCGSIEIAKAASTGLTSPIYHFLNVQSPTQPVEAMRVFGDYFPRYPFHLWDLFSLNKKPLDGYVVTDVDRQYRKVLQTLFSEFAASGRAPSSWPTFNNKSGGETYATGIIDYQGVAAELNAREKQCQLWKDYGFILGQCWNN